MSSLNRAIIVGNLGADPELRYTASNKPVCNLRVATSETVKRADGTKQERTEWHRVVVFGEQGENCAKYLTKGRAVCVEGRIQTRSWDDKDGQKRYATEVVADRVVFLGGGGEGKRAAAGGEQRPGAHDAPASAAGGPLPGDDGIPF